MERLESPDLSRAREACLLEPDGLKLDAVLADTCPSASGASWVLLARLVQLSEASEDDVSVVPSPGDACTEIATFDGPTF